MEALINQRIEEAAKRYAWSHDTIGVDKETFHTESSQKHPIPIDKHVRVPIYHEMEVAFKCAAHFILNNLWISVEEALPKEENLPEFDREVIALQETESKHYYRVVFAHRPADTINVETYGKGGWNIPDIKWWLDLDLPIKY